MPRLLFAASAERDLIEIGNFIGRENPNAAARFVERLEELCRLLASRPLIGRARDDLAAGLRSFPFGRYMISSTGHSMTVPKLFACCTGRAICRGR